MKILKPLFFPLLLFIVVMEGYAQAPLGYYGRAVGKSGRELQDSLCSIINNHRRVHYGCSHYDTLTHITTEYDTCLFKMFPYTDPADGAEGEIYDMYYGCRFRPEQHGNGSVTSNCVYYEREHTFPKSLFQGSRSLAYTDMFNLYPADRVVNNLKNNNPFGEINAYQWERCFQDGSGIGANCYVPPLADMIPYTGTVFEPLDAYKGDFARSLLYISIRYMREDDYWVSDPDSSAMADKSQFRPWMLAMLKEWHYADPVSYKEIQRNNAVYVIQGNRNPLIDHPELVGMIWGNDSTHYTFSEETVSAPHLVAFSQPAADILQLEFNEPMSVNSSNVNIWPGHPEVSEVCPLSSTTVQLVLDRPLVEGQRYKCSLYDLRSVGSQAFMRDTIITLQYGFSTEPSMIAGWTFPEASLSGRVILADADCTADAAAAIYCDGTHGASDFPLGGSDQVTLSNGVATGNFCESESTKALPFKKASTAANNGNAFVIKCSTLDYRNIRLSFASKYTATGFKKLSYEWSNGGEFHLLRHDSLPLTDAADSWRFHVVDFSAVSDLNEQDSILLRVTLNGATGGNVTFDNVFVYGGKCIAENPVIYYDTVYRGHGYSGHGFEVAEVQTQQTGTRVFQREVANVSACSDLYLLYLYVVEPSHVGIVEQTQNQEPFIIYPNPASETVTIKGVNIREVTIFNSLGQKLVTKNANTEQMTLSIRDFPAGLYVFSIITMDGQQVLKKVVFR